LRRQTRQRQCIPTEQWDGLDADAAWKDVIRIWKDTDSKRDGIPFSQSVSTTLKIGAEAGCGTLLETGNCNMALECSQGMDAEDSGPAGMLIWNSFVYIHQIYSDYHDILFKAVTSVYPMPKDLENKFALIPPEPDHTWDLFFIDLLTLGTLSAAGPFSNSFFKKMPYFNGNTGGSLDNAKDTAFTFISQSTTIAKDLLTLTDKEEKWTLESQDEFSAKLGGQDVIDIINTAIEKYGSGGKLGVKGQIACKGNVKDQATTWYIN
jgi:hypothetical protein